MSALSTEYRVGDIFEESITSIQILPLRIKESWTDCAFTVNEKAIKNSTIEYLIIVISVLKM